MENREHDLGTVVKVYAAANGVTVDSIARATGCGRTAFYAKLDGRSPFKFGEAYRLADAIGLSLEELYTLAPAINRA